MNQRYDGARAQDLDGQKFEMAAHVEKVGAAEAQDETDAILDTHITRKMDYRIMPWLFGMWFLASLDRANIGNARIEGLAKDLKLDGVKFNVALLVFYIPYILIDMPSNWVVKHFRAGFYLPCLLIGWGVTCTCLGFTKSYGGLVAARCFLGLFEGGIIGGMLVYLAMFYRRHQMLYRIGLFACAAPLAVGFGGLLAAGLAQIRYGGYNAWPWIFFIEGIMTVLFGILTTFFLPHSPSTAKFLTEEEREYTLRQLKLDTHGASTEGSVDGEHFNWHWVRMALCSPNTIICALAWFFLLIPLYSFALFLPTIIHSLEYSSTTAQLFTVPPSICGVIFILILSAWSDRLKVRGPLMLGCCLLAIAGYIMLLAAKRPAVRYGGTFLIASGVYPGTPLVQGWLSNNLAPHYVRATGIGLQVSIANCAAFIATFAYLLKDAPDYVVGHSIGIGSLVLCMITVACGILYCRWENGKRERGERDDRLKEGSEALLGHQHPRFRYSI